MSGFAGTVSVAAGVSQALFCLLSIDFFFQQPPNLKKKMYKTECVIPPSQIHMLKS